MENSKIEWCDHTFNPWIGCTKVSPGCANCYAETLMDKRYHKVKWGKGNPRSRTSESNWSDPLVWNRKAKKEKTRPRVFCASLADWLDDEVPIQWFLDLMDLIRITPNLQWLLLTKRPENFFHRITAARLACKQNERDRDLCKWLAGVYYGSLISPNYIIGISVENQDWANYRLPILHSIPTERFLSIEPLVAPVRIPKIPQNRAIDWVICGGESGSGSRAMHEDWVRDIRDDCEALNIPFFFKQWGDWHPEKGRIGKRAAGAELDGRMHREFAR